MHNFAKVLRYLRIYGFSITLNKILGRKRFGLSFRFLTSSSPKTIGIVGCGQFSYSTIAFFVTRHFGKCFAACFDPDISKSESFAQRFGAQPAPDFETLLKSPGLKTVFVASNHATHSEYATRALAKDLDVYIEKPLSISFNQWQNLTAALGSSKGKVFAGFNRPHSKAIALLRSFITESQKPLIMSCFVSGHCLPEGHWYLKETEGNPITSNVSHWIDLMVHLFFARGKMPNFLRVHLEYANPQKPLREDLLLSIRTDFEDLFTVTLSSKTEPFEGVSETLNLQCGNTICKIDDFRKMTVWKDEKVLKKRFWPKDPGHENSVLQPFPRKGKWERNWKEVEISTFLTLLISEMNPLETPFRFIDLAQELKKFGGQNH